ncbi:MAG: LysR family transcriptional regulator [Akkermansiaceae bacterium]|nr:LysR family transcriptional regulator [Akkermansiaceae bacterium]
MDYSLRELECFIAVAEERSFTRAARRLHLAQPPLSRHVKALEEKIGAVLFIREPRGVSLTEAANVFYEETRNIPRRLLRAGEAARRCASGEISRLRLGFVSAVMSDELAGVFRSFRAKHPRVHITLHDLPPQDQLDAIADGRLDGGFVGIEPDDSPAGIRFIPWRSEPLVCLVPSGHPLAGNRTVALPALAEESFVAISRASAPAFADKVRDLCAAAGFRPRIVLESTRAQAVALMVSAGSGIALLPDTPAALVKPSARAVPLRPGVKIRHVFACRERRQDGTILDFIRLLR